MEVEKEKPITVLLKASEVATHLKISRALAYRLLKEGVIPSVRVGKIVRVRVDDLEQFIVKSWSGWK